MSEASSEKVTKDNKKEKIVAIISSVIDKVGQNQQISLTSILTELKDLLVVIEETRDELGMARPTDITGKHIPGATDELDAIIEATSKATATIMDSCEVIQNKASEIEGEQSQAIIDETMKIFEACSFQDITGQRVTKVVKTFRDIEDKIDKLVSVLGIKMSDVPQDDQPEGDEALMNGPQLAGEGISQEDIDKLLAEFDE